MATRGGWMALLGLALSAALAAPVVGPPVGRVKPVGELLELRVPLQASYDNPYDPHQIDLRAEITLPDASQVTMPGFYYTPFVENDDGTIEQSGDPLWLLRFTAQRPGQHTFTMLATDRTGTTRASPVTLDVPAAETDGFIHVSPTQPRRLAFESGKPYLPCGINLFFMTPIGKPLPTNRFDSCRRWLGLTASHGGNFARLRMDAWWNEIECTPNDVTGYRGLGWYQPQTCWEIDQFYEIAAAQGLYFMHCLWNANANVNHPQEPWRQPYDPYIKANGGPVETPEEFWTDPVCRDFQQRKLRYCVARWGASRNLMSWEFFNEVSAKAGTIDQAAQWHAEMADYLRAIDPWRHPITTSTMGDRELASKIWSLPQLEIWQEHVYGAPDIPGEMAARMVRAREYGKPAFYGEFGIGPLPGNVWNWDFDTTAVHVHNGLWGAVASGAAGPAAYWFISNFMEPKDCFQMFGPIVQATRDFPWTAADLHPIADAELTWLRPPAELHPIDLTLQTSSAWAFKKSPETRFEVAPDGSIANHEFLRSHLYCAENRKAPPTFVLQSDQPFEFLVHVTGSVGNETNALLAYFDDRLQVDQAFPAGEGHGTSQRHIPQYDNWASAYDETVVIPIPAGEHEVRLEATGKDRLEVEYQLRGYATFESAGPLRALGQMTADHAWVWIHNRSSTWSAAQQDEEPIPIDGMELGLPGLREGRYEAVWFETWSGSAGAPIVVEVKAGRLNLALPRIERDVVLQVRPLP